ncbi:dethiobiotin synthase [Pseudomonas matsuisoli]|uniref:ATP-dependent dethiobiotin synthetase BioD n=1 Tax=Pseudomonas matsuisoli TaxID=1515666 RepID=A0A917V0C8_9PSED|nr:dethiobiotin synthase [Pseudomonas matsuisoli]GGK04466.1 ATP-dependent dethiobiotin synthetase BioD [Pseudomonas matsuisoli]
MTRAYFVTGTDTDAGKTTVATGLLHAARRRGLTTAAVKPVASGSSYSPEGLRNSDALALWAECSVPLTYREVNPYAFEPAIAPHVAAAEVGVELSVNALVRATQKVLDRGADLTVVEGAGGWRVPVNRTEMLSALPVSMGLGVVLVVGVRLGCINHAVLTAEAIAKDGLTVVGWVANVLDPNMARLEESLSTLTQLLTAPCLGRIPRLSNAQAENVASYLDLTALE